jgi:hypothetical protein
MARKGNPYAPSGANRNGFHSFLGNNPFLLARIRAPQTLAFQHQPPCFVRKNTTGPFCFTNDKEMPMVA